MFLKKKKKRFVAQFMATSWIFVNLGKKVSLDGKKN
jgi:hypothetical protein